MKKKIYISLEGDFAYVQEVEDDSGEEKELDVHYLIPKKTALLMLEDADRVEAIGIIEEKNKTGEQDVN